MKSDVKELYLKIVECIYYDASAKCTANVQDLRDLKTIRSRVEKQGLSYLTITLPAYGKAIEQCLAAGRLDSNLFPYYLRWGKRRAIPPLLGGMLSRLFDFDTGELLNETPANTGGVPDHSSVYVEAIRQICLCFKKLEVPCAPARVQAAIKNFVNVERSFDDFEVTEELLAEFRQVSSLLWHNLVATFDHEEVELQPKHGPGGVAEKLAGNRKYAWRRWHERLEQYFPFVGTAYPLSIADATTSKEFEMLTLVSPEQEQPVRVVTVPKTLKGPRVIAIEPTCMQFVQQGVRDWLYQKIETYPLSRGHVNFRDQSINRDIALASSSTGQMATIDLSDASDRVPLSLAMVMFEASATLSGIVQACRSDSAQLPNGEIIQPLRKFASMGSALCFPIEAMYFYTVSVAALLREMHLSVNAANVHMVSRGVYVYGDDISVPANYAVAVLDHLQRYNCKVNASKSFWTGMFRESCGMDAYAGEDVTPTYLTQPVPEDRQQAKQLIAWVEAGNHFYKRGYWRTASLLHKVVERHLGKIPYVSDESSALGRVSYLGYRYTSGTKIRWNRKLHKLEVLAYVPKEVRRTDELGGFSALAKSLSGPDGPVWRIHRSNGFLHVIPSPPPDKARLAQSVRRGSVTLKRRWVDVH